MLTIFSFSQSSYEKEINIGMQFNTPYNPGVKTKDGGFALLVSKFNKSGYKSISVTKFDSLGNIQWSKDFNMIPFAGESAITSLSDNGYAIAVTFSSLPIPGYYSSIMKLDSMGNIIWVKKITSASSITIAFTKIIENADKSITAAGSAYVGSNVYTSIMLLSTDQNGNLLWSKSYEENSLTEIIDLVQTADKGFILGGTKGNDYNSSNFYVLKVDKKGNAQWSKIFHGQTINAFSDFRSILQTSDSGYIFAGNYPIQITKRKRSSAETVIKIDSNGNQQWSENLGLSSGPLTTLIESGTSYLLAGYKDKTNFIKNINQRGKLLSATSFGSPFGGTISFFEDKNKESIAISLDTTKSSLFIAKFDKPENACFSTENFADSVFAFKDSTFSGSPITVDMTGTINIKDTIYASRNSIVTNISICSQNSFSVSALPNFYSSKKLTENKFQFTISPNPTRNSILNLNITNDKYFSSEISITGNQGQILYKQTQSFIPGKYPMQLILPKLSTGIYYLSIISNNKKYVNQFEIIE